MFREFSIKIIKEKIQNKELNPIDIAEECISRYEKLDSTYRSWVCFDKNKLLTEAESCNKRLKQGEKLRSLEGIPIGVKDIFNTIDFPTQMGSPIWKGFTPGNDARVVYNLKNAGGIIAGKTVTAEFAVHALNETQNPHNQDLSPGTSSSGSAVAVSLGIVPVSIGSQTAGSIIRPASYCGVYGCKPSFGLIPRTGSLKTTDSLDAVGFFAAHPCDLELVFNTIRVHGPNFPISYRALKDHSRQNKPKSRPWKVAFVKTHTWNQAPEYAMSAMNDFINKIDTIFDIEVHEVRLPVEMELTHSIHETIYNKSLSYYFSSEYDNTELVSAVMSELITKGEAISTKKYHDALVSQNKLITVMDKFFQNYDVILSLSTQGIAPLRTKEEPADPALMWSLTHLPVISAPVFTSSDNCPFGLQVSSRKYNDLLLFKFIEYLRTNKLIPEVCNPIVEL